MYSSDKQMNGIYRANVLQSTDYSATLYIPSLHRDQMPFSDPSNPSAGVSVNSDGTIIANGKQLTMKLSDYPTAHLCAMFTVFPLELGDAVWVIFENGDVNYPFILGRLGSTLDEGDLLEVLAGSGGTGSSTSSSGSSSLSGSDSSTDVSSIIAGAGEGKAALAVKYAISKLGCPYVWGATGPNSFDCSGLVQWAYAQAGVSIPRVTTDQLKCGTPVNSIAESKPGDLLFPHEGHVVMIVEAGTGKCIHAPQTGDVVKFSTYSSFAYLRRISD